MTYICVNNLTIIGWDNGLSPDRRQTILWTNVGIFLIGPLGTHFSEIIIDIHIFSLNEMLLKMSSGKWQPSCLGLNVLNDPTNVARTRGSNWQSALSAFCHCIYCDQFMTTVIGCSYTSRHTDTTHIPQELAFASQRVFISKWSVKCNEEVNEMSIIEICQCTCILVPLKASGGNRNEKFS